MLRAAHVRLSFNTLAAIVSAAALSVLAPLAVAARPDPSKVKDIKTFVACLNMIKRANGTIADAAKCVPPCCNFVVTMSPKSAQAACELGGCKLPRVIFDCPGPSGGKRFRPSFLLCPIDSKGAGDQFGTDRTELGEDVDDKGNMKMADVPAPPGTTDFTKITEGDVLSKADQASGTKGCNAGCHNEPATGNDPDNNELSDPIDPFGKFNGMDLAPFIIDTDEPGKTVPPNVKMSLAKICKCIKKNQDKIKQAANDPTVVKTPGDRNPNLDVQILLKLCRKLKHKIPRKPCGTPRDTPTPTPTTPPPSQTPTPTPSATPTDTPKDTPTDAATPTHTGAATQTATNTSIVTNTPNVTPSQPATATSTTSPMVTPTGT
jgi:hypothetical protein